MACVDARSSWLWLMVIRTTPEAMLSVPAGNEGACAQNLNPPEVIPRSADDPVFSEFSASVARGDLIRATAIVRESWFELLRSHGEPLRKALDTLPPTALRSHPLLTLMLGICYNGVPHKRVKALRYFATAVRAARSGRLDLIAVDRALILASESAVYRLIGRPAMGVGAARSAIRVLDAMAESEIETVHSLPRIYSQAGLSLYYGGQVDEALTVFVAGLAESRENASSDGFGNLSMLAGIHALRGDVNEAHTYVELARSEVWTDEQRSMYTGTFYRIAEALAALERFDPVTAREHLAAMVNDPRTIEHWITIAKTQALTSLFSGRPGEALARLDSFAAMRNEGRSSAARSAFAPTRALLQLALGARDAAGAIIQRDAPAGPYRHVARARLDLVVGHNGAALRELRAVGGADIPSRTVAEAATIEAAALLRFSKSARSVGVVEHLGSLLDQTGQRLVLALVPPADLERVRAALTEHGFGHLFDGVDIWSVLPDASPSTILTERELIVLDGLMRNGSPTRIAADLVVSVNTVKTQLRSIYRKLGVSNRDEAIAVALDRHLLSDHHG
jgi:LuxR family maltose regulon positive regulatory protein